MAEKKFNLRSIFDRNGVKTDLQPVAPTSPAQAPPKSILRRLRGAFLGGAFNRLTNDWVGSILSPDQDIWADFIQLRSRARDLEKNNPYAARYLTIASVNVIGPHGMRLQARNKNRAGELDTVVNQTIEQAFEKWAENASIDGLYSWEELQSLIMKTVARDGEVFVRIVTGEAADNPFGIALQVLDGDFLDFNYNVWGNGKDENDIRFGIEMDRNRKRVAYHFFTGHPSEGRVGVHRIRVPADQVIHLYDPLSVQQTRGVTWFTPAMYPLHMLQEFMMAELVAARTAASKMGFITSQADTIDPGMLPDEDGLPDMPNEVIDAQPGSVQRLSPGELFQEWNPSHPSTAFEAFTKTILRSVASALNVSYSNLSGDFTSENYSSARVGLLTERDHWREVQHWVIRNLHKRVYAKWLDAALLSGSLKLGTRSPSPFMDVEFSPRGWQWVDPQKEAIGNGALIGLGLTSRTKVCREQGIEINDVLADLAREQEEAKRLGINIDGARETIKAEGNPPPEPTEDPPAVDPTSEQNDN